MSLMQFPGMKQSAYFSPGGAGGAAIKPSRRPLAAKHEKITAEMRAGLESACSAYLKLNRRREAGKQVVSWKIEKAVEGIYRALEKVKKANPEFTLADGPVTFGIHVGVGERFGITCNRLINLRIVFERETPAVFYMGDTRENLDRNPQFPISMLNEKLMGYARAIAGYEWKAPEQIRGL